MMALAISFIIVTLFLVIKLCYHWPTAVTAYFNKNQLTEYTASVTYYVKC